MKLQEKDVQTLREPSRWRYGPRRLERLKTICTDLACWYETVLDRSTESDSPSDVVWDIQECCSGIAWCTNEWESPENVVAESIAWVQRVLFTILQAFIQDLPTEERGFASIFEQLYWISESDLDQHHTRHHYQNYSRLFTNITNFHDDHGRVSFVCDHQTSKKAKSPSNFNMQIHDWARETQNRSLEVLFRDPFPREHPKPRPRVMRFRTIGSCSIHLVEEK
jgi:hypothetical protein